MGHPVNYPPPILQDAYSIAPSELASASLYAPGDESTQFSPKQDDSSRPYVTLTFAQSLDAKIAGAGGAQLILSGKESTVMTHWMRTLHDAILVGIGTALNDDPQLNTRHLPPLPAGVSSVYRLPRPIILDGMLRLRPQCKLLKNYQEQRGRRPWVVCHKPISDASTTAAWSHRKAELEEAGAHTIEVPLDESTGLLDVPHLLQTLCSLGVRSLMVEGGAQVIRSFLSSAHGERGIDKTSGSGGAVDSIIITVAPTLVGSAGIGYGTDLLTEELPVMEHVATTLCGRDAVVAMKVA